MTTTTWQRMKMITTTYTRSICNIIYSSLFHWWTRSIFYTTYNIRRSLTNWYYFNPLKKIIRNLEIKRNRKYNKNNIKLDALSENFLRFLQKSLNENITATYIQLLLDLEEMVLNSTRKTGLENKLPTLYTVDIINWKLKFIT